MHPSLRAQFNQLFCIKEQSGYFRESIPPWKILHVRVLYFLVEHKMRFMPRAQLYQRHDKSLIIYVMPGERC